VKGKVVKNEKKKKGSTSSSPVLAGSTLLPAGMLSLLLTRGIGISPSGMLRNGCPGCRNSAAKGDVKVATHTRKDGKVEIVFRLPFYNKVKELLDQRGSLNVLTDLPIWEKIFAGDTKQFEKLTEEGKNFVKETAQKIKRELRKFELSKKEIASLSKALKDESGASIVPWLSRKTKTKSQSFSMFLEAIRERMPNGNNNQLIIITRRQIKKLLATIPAELHNATEPPHLRIDQDDLPEAIRVQKLLIEAGFTTGDLIRRIINILAEIDEAKLIQKRIATLPEVAKEKLNQKELMAFSRIMQILNHNPSVSPKMAKINEAFSKKKA
jgi:hypothetical protein